MNGLCVLNESERPKLRELIKRYEESRSGVLDFLETIRSDWDAAIDDARERFKVLEATIDDFPDEMDVILGDLS